MNVIIPILLPLLAALLIQVSGRLVGDDPKGNNLRDGLHTLMAVITFFFVTQLVPDVMSGERPSFLLSTLFSGGTIEWTVEPLGLLFALVASGLWIVTSIYGFGYMRGHEEQHQTRFFTCFALAISFAIGVAFSANLLTLFAFYEALTFSTFPLVTHYQNAEAKRAGRIYIGILVTTSVCLLLSGVAGVYFVSGTLEFTPGGVLAGKAESGTIMLLLALFAFGTAKAALFPFHKWLPNAMVAPTPVSALLHAVAVVKAGVFTILKVIIYIFGLDLLSETNGSDWLMAVAAFTILFSSVVALFKDNLKARLAYSTISQLSYIVLGAAMANPAAALGAAMHIVMHAVGKITLFFCAGAIFVGAHKKYISQMDGLAHKMPWTMAAFTVASFSIIGVPPLGGMWSKWFLGQGALEAEAPIYMVVLMISSLLSIGYLMPVVARAYFRTPAEKDAHLHEAPLLCVIPLCITAVGCVLLFLFPTPLRDLLLPILGEVTR